MVGNRKYRQFYVLGDSLSDTGSFIAILNYVRSTLPFVRGGHKELYFALPFYEGRSFSNGPMGVEWVANQLGVSLTSGWRFTVTPALKHWSVEKQTKISSTDVDSLIQKEGISQLSYTSNEQVGTNYSISNARASCGHSLISSLLFNHFQFKNQLKTLLSHHPHIGEGDLLFILIGGNDIMAAAYSKDPSSILKEGISEIYNGLVALAAYRGIHVIVSTVPDIGIIPAFIHSEKQEIVSKLVREFNGKLQEAIEDFKKSYSQVNIKLFLLDALFREIIVDYKKRGYVMEQPCLSNVADHPDPLFLLEALFDGELRANYVCGCSDTKISNYLFFDYFHPTGGVHQIVGNSLYNFIMER